MSGPLPSGRLLELPMEPGEMPGMPQPHLTSCNGKQTRQFHLKTKQNPELYNILQKHKIE